jgi:hypothetical protein
MTPAISGLFIDVPASNDLAGDYNDRGGVSHA